MRAPAPLLFGIRHFVVAPGIMLGVAVCAFVGGCGDSSTLTTATPSVLSSTLSEAEVDAHLASAIAAYEATRLEMLLQATDPNERFETLLGPSDVQFLVDADDYESLFAFGDEAFEAERDRVQGVGQSSALDDTPLAAGLPARPRRLHEGDRGGLDATSCRGCHFSGGPDGGGTKTQTAFFRGDGIHLSTAVERDAPHVMGLGYLELHAFYLTESLLALAATGAIQAEASGAPFLMPLVVDDIDFGFAVFSPDGTVDVTGVRGVSADFVVRPFGHKGRHASLSALADEAQRLHFGLQSTTEELRHATSASQTLGDGPLGDRDDDGVVDELSAAPAVVLAAYMAMLPVPVMRPPTDATLVAPWRRGFDVFSEAQCASCHRPTTRLQWTDFTIRAGPGSTLFVPMSPLDVGHDPKPENLDFGDEESGIPFFPFTDFRRHDMGPLLADVDDEQLPSGGHIVDKNDWLTRPLWGLADTAPYLHDGRAPTIHDAIMWHGGDASSSRIAYTSLSEDDQRALVIFLTTLTRTPALVVE